MEHRAGPSLPRTVFTPGHRGAGRAVSGRFSSPGSACAGWALLAALASLPASWHPTARFPESQPGEGKQLCLLHNQCMWGKVVHTCSQAGRVGPVHAGARPLPGVPPYCSRTTPSSTYTEFYQFEHKYYRESGDGSSLLTAHKGGRQGPGSATRPLPHSGTGQERWYRDDGKDSGPGSLGQEMSSPAPEVFKPCLQAQRGGVHPTPRLQAWEGLGDGPSALHPKVRTSVPPIPSWPAITKPDAS